MEERQGGGIVTHFPQDRSSEIVYKGPRRRFRRGQAHRNTFPEADDRSRALTTMGCTMCSQLMDAWCGSERYSTRRAMELTGMPDAAHAGYHRATGLHYTSSFSDAEDCCEDTSTGSSLTMEWKEGPGD